VHLALSARGPRLHTTLVGFEVTLPSWGSTDKAITQMIHAVWGPYGQTPTCPALTDYLDRTIVDVEGFWRGEATPLFVIPCISRSAGSACPGAVSRWKCSRDGGEDPRGGRRGVPRPDIDLPRVDWQPGLASAERKINTK